MSAASRPFSSATRSAHSVDDGAASPAPASGPIDLGTSMIPAGRRMAMRRGRTEPSRHRRRGRRSESRRLRDIASVVVPALLLATLIAIDLIAFLVSPLHIGPLPAELVVVLVAATAPLTYTASRRLGLSTVGAVVAAAVAALVLPTASSDVAGAPEHAAVVAGLGAVTLWPFNISGTIRRYAAGLLGGLAVVASPFAIVAIAAAILWLVRETEDRARRVRALRGPVIANAAAAAVGLVLLVVFGVPLDEWTWGGAFSLATVIISVGPALGFLAGVGADAAVTAAASPEPMPRFAGVIGGLALALLLAAATGSAIAQIRDRALVGELDPQTTGISIGPVLTVSPLDSPNGTA